MDIITLIENISFIIGYLFGYYVLAPIYAALSMWSQFVEALPF